ncbi:hypothetical protein MTO96_052311 [Rhipicephalus appendiculatus]
MITHAKVRYEDDRKLAIVDVRDIQNFQPEHAKDFKSKFFYFVKWTDPDGTSDYYRARILALGESEDDLEVEGGGRQRLRVEKMTYSPDSEDGDDDDVQPEVDIGGGLCINSSGWNHIQGHQKDSIFVKDLLLGIWPKEQLKNRSLQGKRCPRFPDRPAKAPLTPWKVEVMRGISDSSDQRIRSAEASFFDVAATTSQVVKTTSIPSHVTVYGLKTTPTETLLQI